MTARPTARPGTAALAERAALLGPQEPEPAVDLEQLAEVVRLAFPPATTASGAEVTA